MVYPREEFAICTRCRWVHGVWTADPGEPTTAIACQSCGHPEMIANDGMSVPDGSTMPCLVVPPGWHAPGHGDLAAKQREAWEAGFVGKTVAALDARVAGIWRFRFTDGSEFAIEAGGHPLKGSREHSLPADWADPEWPETPPCARTD